MKELIEDFKRDFRNEFPHIYDWDHNVDDEHIERFIERNMDVNYRSMLYYFSDYIMSQGLCEVVE